MTATAELKKPERKEMVWTKEEKDTLKHDVEVTNPKTNVTSKVTLQGIQDFFGSASPTTA